MEDPAEPSKPPLAELLRRAQRTQEVVGAVDFSKISRHDAEEVAKLEGVTDALSRLAEGQSPDYIEGVDEVAPHDPDYDRRAALLIYLEEQGFGERLGKVHSHSHIGSGQRDHLLDLIPHREGLPEFDFCLSSSKAPSNGAQAVFISGHAAFLATISKPFNRHHWQVTDSRSYQDPKELGTLIETLTAATD